MERKMIAAIVGVVIFILILFIYTVKPIQIVSDVPLTPKNPKNPKNPLVGTAKTWRDLSPNDKLDYLVTKYFNYDVGSGPDPKVTKENNYIASLPQDAKCQNDFTDCGQWAANGECDINPEYMLYNCKSSCKSCALSEQEKHNVSSILNSRSPPGCVFHGFDYPGSLPIYYKILNYH